MTECLIVGGGILGMLTANELHNAGMSVTLVEMGRPGRESSWAGGGIISPLYPWRYDDALSLLAQWSQARYPAIAEMLIEAGGPDPEYTKSGLLILEPGDTDKAEAWAAQFGQPLQLIDREGITRCETGLDTGATSAVWLPEVAQIRNPRLTKSLYHALAQKITFHEYAEVTGLIMEGDHAQGNRIRGIKTPTGALEADKVIICAGAWSGDLLGQIITPPAIEPVLGQMILFRYRPGEINRIVLHNDRYLIPRKDGRVVVGSTLEYRGFDKHTTEEAKQALKSFALAHFPSLKEAEIEHHWCGLRPGSPRGIPYIGPVPGAQGLYVNAGHFRNGVVLGPASARLMADIVLGREPILDPAPYAIDARRDN